MTVESFFTDLESKLDAQILEYKQRGSDPPMHLLEMRSYCKHASNGSSTARTAESLFQKVLNAPDLIKTITYTDTDTPDERITEIRIESAATDAAFIDAYSYAGVSGNYRLIALARTQVALGGD